MLVLTNVVRMWNVLFHFFWRQLDFFGPVFLENEAKKNCEKKKNITCDQAFFFGGGRGGEGEVQKCGSARVGDQENEEKKNAFFFFFVLPIADSRAATLFTSPPPPPPKKRTPDRRLKKYGTVRTTFFMSKQVCMQRFSDSCFCRKPFNFFSSILKKFSVNASFSERFPEKSLRFHSTDSNAGHYNARFIPGNTGHA